MRKTLATLKAKTLSLARKPNARQAAGLTALMYLSPLIGLVLDNVLARAFGVSTALDIFRLITSFLMLGTGLVAGTLLKFAIIPELARAKAANDMVSGLRFVIAITAQVFALMLPFILCGLLAPGWMLHLLGPGLPVTPEAYALVQVAALGFALMIISSAGGALLQFYGTFWAQPAGQVALNSALMLVVLTFAHQATTLGEQLHVLTVGLGIGVVCWLCVFTILLGRLWHKHLRRNPQNHHQPWRKIAMLAAIALAPQILIMGCEILKNIAINRALSFTEPGSLVLYTFAYKLLMLVSLPIMAITTILFPRTASNHASGIQNPLQDKKHLQQLVAVALLLVVTLWLNTPLIIAILFGLANLSADEFTKLAEAFRILIWIVPASAVGLFILNHLYARNKRVSILVYYIINMVLVGVFVAFSPVNTLHSISYAVMLSQVMASAFLWLGWRYLNLSQPLD